MASSNSDKDTPPAVEAAVTTAARRLDAAERELADALAQLPHLDRSEKQVVGSRMQTALAEIVAARRALAEVVDLDASDESDD